MRLLRAPILRTREADADQTIGRHEIGIGQAGHAKRLVDPARGVPQDLRGDGAFEEPPDLAPARSGRDGHDPTAASRGEPATESEECRQLLPTGRTPRGPEVNEHRLPLPPRSDRNPASRGAPDHN